MRRIHPHHPLFSFRMSWTREVTRRNSFCSAQAPGCLRPARSNSFPRPAERLTFRFNKRRLATALTWGDERVTYAGVLTTASDVLFSGGQLNSAPIAAGSSLFALRLKE